MIARLHQRFALNGYDDIRPAHGTVVRHLSLEGTRLTEIAARAQLTKQTIGYLVDDLASLGYVERVPDPKDARARLIRFTQKGLAARMVAIAALADIEAEWAAALGPPKMAQLRALLAELLVVIDIEDQRVATPS